MDFNPIDGAGSPRSPGSNAWTQEDHDLFSRVMNEAGPSSSAAPGETVYDVSWAVPQEFSHGSQPAPDRMVERLSHLGLVPDPEQPTMSYDIHGHRYTAALDPSNRVRLIHNPPDDQMIGAGPAGVPDFDKHQIWRELEPGLLPAGPSQAGPSQAGPSSSAGATPRELGDFVMENGRRASEHWVFNPQTASNAQMNMLRSVGLMPSEDSPTTFSILGVPHTAEWREANFVRLNPSLDPGP
ncbi:hypothetical protein ACVJGD_008459 [Bradyrhizobium sp. USDA 10063]